MKLDKKSFFWGLSVGAIGMFVLSAALLEIAAVMVKREAKKENAHSYPDLAFCPTL